MKAKNRLRTLSRKLALADMVKSRAGKTPSKERTEYWNGDIPWITAKDMKTSRLISSKKCITRAAVVDGAPLAQPGDVLILVRGMTLLKNVPVGYVDAPMSYNQDVRCLHPEHKHVSGEYLRILLAASRAKLMSAVTQAGHGTGRLDGDQLLATVLPLPPLKVQEWLAKRLNVVESHITTIERLIKAKIGEKRELSRTLLGGQHQKGRRLASRLVRLADHSCETTTRNEKGLGPDRVMGVFKSTGLIPRRARLRAADLRRYKTVAPGAFAYNPMRLNIGSIARSAHADDCLVSPDYVVFQTNHKSLLPEYLDQIRRSHIWERFVRQAGTGSVRVRIHYDDLASIQFPLPPLAMQKRISRLLETYDREISLLEALRKAHLAQNDVILQRLLTGQLQIPASVSERNRGKR